MLKSSHYSVPTDGALLWGSWGLGVVFIEFQKSSDQRRQARVISLIHLSISHSVEFGSKTRFKGALAPRQLSACDPPGTEPTAAQGRPPRGSLLRRSFSPTRSLHELLWMSENWCKSKLAANSPDRSMPESGFLSKTQQHELKSLSTCPWGAGGSGTHR